jgi:hypothetical protein
MISFDGLWKALGERKVCRAHGGSGTTDTCRPLYTADAIRTGVPSFGFRQARWKGYTVSDFWPDGYVPTQKAIAMAAQHWFAERFDALEAATEAGPPAKSESHIEEAVRAFSQPQIPEVWGHAFEETVSQTVHRLRNFLHQGKLDAYYFESDGRQTVPRDC